MTAPSRRCVPLVLALLLAGCSGGAADGPTSTTTTAVVTTSTAGAPAAAATSPGAAPAAATAASSTFVPKATAVQDAIAEVRRAPGGSALDPAFVGKSLKGACGSHLAGLGQAELVAAVRGELEAARTPDAAGVAARVIAASQRHMCP